ncbi:MAG: hypothetical protein M0R28_15800 [Pigmentiphaga sp.]|nr:hypothetical protein [Pigmentiphaga sp.]
MATGAAESVHLGAGEHNVIVLDVRDDADDFALKTTGQHDIMPWLVG